MANSKRGFHFVFQLSFLQHDLTTADIRSLVIRLKNNRIINDNNIIIKKLIEIRSNLSFSSFKIPVYSISKYSLLYY